MVGAPREEQIALSLKRHLFPHGGREPKAFWICFLRVHPPSEIKSNFKFKTLKRHLLKRHLTLSDRKGSQEDFLFAMFPMLRNEKSAQRGSFWPDVPADIRQKPRYQALQVLEETSILAPTSPRGRPWKNFGLKNFGLICRSLNTFIANKLGLQFGR